MHDRITLIWYQSALGADTVIREIRKFKLTAGEENRLRNVIRRVTESKTVSGDVVNLGNNLLEMRIRFPHRQLRLIYFVVFEPTRFVVVFAGIKKSQQTPRMWLQLAQQRRKQWLS